jgi:maltose alpha-D-glucosyltransferase/alpha-amylase
MLPLDPLWYKKTIFYELHVRSFADGNGDGIGDFKGLMGKLGYLKRLGVGAVWLLPFYPSPLRDDGYDISDYMKIHPDYGTLADFKRFLREAHNQGIRVVTELVLNHTSDQHPWFLRARRARPGSQHRGYYVWSDTPDKFHQARIIFSDFEHSNWAWDPVAKSNYWHRFYSHQPDLNFDNPKVHQEMLKVVDHWLEMGVDGLRLDAVPYLYEREGTNCENLPETHVYLKKLRAHVEATFPDRMLLAEANQWPEDAVDYFGQGDECHMAYNFPVMPRIFMSLWMEDRHPILDIMAQTPTIPENCQWALFLRNHDELTLEMVSDEERDYMYRAYARESKARINLGIRRRLAPLMQNNRRKMELINFLLFSFPGSPIIYYGDELGMGDNYHLGDRNGVRTPMQWCPDRNAGFSQANPQSLYLPVIIDPEYHYEVVNAETAERNASSFLWWMRRLIALYKSLPALGEGSLIFVGGNNTKVLSFLRGQGEQQLLVVANLSRHAQVTELDLGDLAGVTPVEVFGNTRFPVIRKEPYVLTLGPLDYFWFLLEKATTQPSQVLSHSPFALSVDTERGVGHKENLATLESHLLPAALARIPREAPSSDAFLELKILDSLPVRSQEPGATLFLVDTTHGQAPRDHHLLFVSVATGHRAEKFTADSPDAVMAHLQGGADGKILVDGFDDPEAVVGLAALMGTSKKRHGKASRFVADFHAPLSLRKVLADPPGPARPVHSSPHTVSYSLGNAAFLKVFRHPEEGGHPEVEILSILNKAGFEGVPRIFARLAYHGPLDQTMTLAVAMEYVHGSVNGAAFVQDTVELFLDKALASGITPPQQLPDDPFTQPQLSKEQQGMVDEYSLEFFRRLAGRLARFHSILASQESSSFAPEPVTKLYLRSLYQTMRNLFHNTARSIGRIPQGSVPADEVANEADALRSQLSESAILMRFSKLLKMAPMGIRIRTHGDLQLENVLQAGKDFVLVDFDGDVRLPLGERSIKRPALRDVANMIASMAIIVEKALRQSSEKNPAREKEIQAWGYLWRRVVGLAFFEAYTKAVRGSNLIAKQEEVVKELLLVFLLEHLLRILNRSVDEAPQDVPMLIELTELFMKLFQ